MPGGVARSLRGARHAPRARLARRRDSPRRGAGFLPPTLLDSAESAARGATRLQTGLSEANTTHVLHRQCAHLPPLAVGARGIEIFDAEGRAYIDA